MLCLRYARNKEEAEDMLQEGFMRIFKDIRQYDSEKGNLLPWLRKVMLNSCLQYLRKHRVQLHIVNLEEDNSSYTSDDDVFAKMSTKELIRLIQTLPDGYRIVFNMFVLEGYKHQEIANTLAISESTSKSQLHKAKAMLRSKIRAFRSMPYSTEQKAI